MGIIIVGLGPGNPEQLTLEGKRKLEEAEEIYLRICSHPSAPQLAKGATIHSFDHLYEEMETFDQVYEEIASQIVALGRRPEGVIYAVPGHPLVGERSVRRILALGEEEGMELEIVAGLSFLEPVLTALKLDAMAGLQLIDALELAALLLPPLNPDRPALVGQLHSREVASEAKLTLMNLYPPDHPVALLRRAGTAQEEVRSLPLYQLDRDAELDEWTALYLPPLARPSSLAELQETMARLRAPDGCPWDREQTPQSLRHNLLEETYEVLEAIDEDDGIKLKEELGDLLMQIVLQVQIAAEGGEFTMAEVAEGIIAKLKSRHPHVFADLSLADSREVLQHWERTKAEERGGKGSPLADLPLALPALARAQAMQGRAATVGFDWQDVGGVVDKVIEEVRELKGARDEERATQELGDLLFSLVNLARWLNLDAESALRQANQRFFQRFTQMEHLTAEKGLELANLSPEEQDELWEQAKDRGGQIRTADLTDPNRAR